ncbi:MAG: GNAT family N-acetyltransferase [Bacillota bacterium]
MAIIYKENLEIESKKLIKLYASVNWKSYLDKPKNLAKLIKNSLYSISAWDKNELIGFIRIVGDGLSIIYVQDLLVEPKYQRKGIGKTLLTKVFDKFSHVRQTVLITDSKDKSNSFYQALGMKSADDMGISTYLKFND